MENMVQIRKASEKDISIIQEIARKTWPITYGEILSKEQLAYMLDNTYSDTALMEQFQNKHQFYILFDGVKALGFISLEHYFKNKLITRIHKIYVLKEAQGKGIGQYLMNYIERVSLENHSECLSLNVNRFNSATSFYKKNGFQIVFEENIAIGNGYFMEDYRMEKQI